MDMMKEADFKTYCPKCVHKDHVEDDGVCNECLTVPAQEETRKPINYKEA